jgi:hypothetical protein
MISTDKCRSEHRLTRVVASAANRIFGLIVWPVAGQL